MFNGFLTRIVAAVGLFVAGLHVIGWGMIENGSAHPRNPIWQRLSSFFAFELEALKFLGWVALAIVAIFVAIRAVLGLRERLGAEKSPESMQEATRCPSAPALTYCSTPSPRVDVIAPVPTRLPERRPEPAPPRPAPTPEELKKKAIDQILKGV